MDTNIVEKKKTCPRCQVIFSCFSANCWCNELPQIMPLSAHEDCLCNDCLKAEIDARVETSLKS